jgi:hypothetical protein
MFSELAAVGGSHVDEWKCLTLGQILDTFSLHDVYNAGDTGLFWKALRDCTQEFKNGSFATEKLICLICVSVAGEKVPLLVIGKYAKPGLSSMQIACLVNTRLLEKLEWLPSYLVSSC